MSENEYGTGGPRPAADASGTDAGSTTRTFTKRSRATVVGVLAVALTTGGLSAMPAAQAINSNPPTGPGNIEIFPQRDMVAIEGYTEQAGLTATITATRGGQVVGKTVGTVGADGFLDRA